MSGVAFSREKWFTNYRYLCAIRVTRGFLFTCVAKGNCDEEQ